MEEAAKVREVSQWQQLAGMMWVIFMLKEVKVFCTTRDASHLLDENTEIIFVPLISK